MQSFLFYLTVAVELSFTTPDRWNKKYKRFKRQRISKKPRQISSGATSQNVIVATSQPAVFGQLAKA